MDRLNITKFAWVETKAWLGEARETRIGWGRDWGVVFGKERMTHS